MPSPSLCEALTMKVLKASPPQPAWLSHFLDELHYDPSINSYQNLTTTTNTGGTTSTTTNTGGVPLAPPNYQRGGVAQFKTLDEWGGGRRRPAQKDLSE